MGCASSKSIESQAKVIERVVKYEEKKNNVDPFPENVEQVIQNPKI